VLAIGASQVLLNYRPMLVVLGVVGVALAGLSVIHPVLGLMALLLAMLLSPEVAIGRTGERAISIGGADVLIVLVVIGWIVHQATQREGMLLRSTPVSLPVYLMIGVIVLATLIGILMGTVSPLRGFFFASKRIEYFLIFFMVTTLLRGWEDVRIALILFVIACAGINIGAIIQEVFFPEASGVTSTFGYGRANTLGGFYVMALSMTIGLMTYVRRRWVRSLLMVQFVLTILCLAFTHSRGAYVSVPFAVGTLMFVDRSKRLFEVSGLVVLALAALLLGAWMLLGGEDSFFLARQKRIMAGQFGSIADVATQGAEVDPSLHSRLRAWRQSVDQILRYPFLGQGVGAKKLGWADNHYVRELLETGVIGLVVFLWMNFQIFLAVLHLHHSSEGIVRGAAVGFLGGQVGLLAHAMTCSNFYTIRTMEPFWYLLGLLMAVAIAAENRPPFTAVAQVEDAPQAATT